MPHDLRVEKDLFSEIEFEATINIDLKGKNGVYVVNGNCLYIDFKGVYVNEC